MDLETLQATILAHVNSANYHPVKPKVLVKQLGFETDDEIGQFRKALKKLLKAKQIVYGDRHLVCQLAKPKGRPTGKHVADYTPADETAPEGAAGEIIGRFRRTQGGFGFVRPQRAPGEPLGGADWFIAAENTADAATGDTVAIRKEGKKARGRMNPEARIVRIVERGSHQFVGTYFEEREQAYVKLDGTTFDLPIWVGDPGAKLAQTNDKVVIELVRYPTHKTSGEGVIREVLGARGQPGVDTLSIMREYELEEQFAEDALEQARLQAIEFDRLLDGPLPADRTDLTSAIIITIDPQTARDFDDAISLERTDKGHWRLGVHIADVAYFVPEKSPLDREARERATSVYLPDRVIPMLPELISNGLASLQPDRVRFTKSAFMELSEDGTVLSTDLCRAAIKSCQRFTYEEVDAWLADPATVGATLRPEIHQLLERMRDLARILRARRRVRGALELHLPAVKIQLDQEGQVCGAAAEVQTESHEIIEEFMLAANVAVATRITNHGWPLLRRVHRAPNPDKLKEVTEFVKELGFPVENLQDRFELQKLLNEVADKPLSRAVHFAILRSLPRATYSPAEEGHFALAFDCYCHFTSPIRRYPDLSVHRLVDDLIDGRQARQNITALENLGDHCSQREQRAEEAERELTKIKLLTYLQGRIGLELDAVITGVENFGLFVQGRELPAEGLLPIDSLPNDYYDFEGPLHRLTGRRTGIVFHLGNPVKVAVAAVDVDRRQLNFKLVEGPEAGAAPPAPTGETFERKPRGKPFLEEPPHKKRGHAKKKRK